MSVLCSASSVGGFERVSRADADAIRAIRDARELKEFMRRWGDANL